MGIRTRTRCPSVAAAARVWLATCLVGATAHGGLWIDGGEEVIAEVLVASGFDLQPAEEKAAPKKMVWKSHFDFGAGASFGNTDSQDFHAGITSVREVETLRTTLDAHYYYGSSNGDRDENRFTAGVLHDWLTSTPWLYFLGARYDYDEFQSWERRLGAHGGVGYNLVDEGDLVITLRGGTGATKEWGSAAEDFRPEGLLGAGVRWKITERQSIEGGATYYPNLEELGKFRTVSRLAWALTVDSEMNMSLTLSLEHEYQSQIDPGRDHNDLRLIAGLQFDF